MSTPAPSVDKRPLALACLLIAIGTGWLLTELKIVPRVDWIWIFGLIVAGLLMFLLSGGIDKASIVLGPLLMVSGGLSMLRQSGTMPFNVELPCLVIIAGVLLAIAQSPRIPAPRWYTPTVPRD